MKQKKQLNLYPFYDLEGMEAHLERMGERGWKLKKTNGLFFTYEPCEKKTVHYAICCGGESSAYTPGPDCPEPSFRKHAEAGGWSQVCATEKLQVYCSEEPNPGPFHANPYDRIEGIRQAAGPVLFLYGTMMGLGILSLLLFFFKLKNTPINLLSGALGILSPLVLTLLAAYSLADMILYFRFKNAADVAATRKEFAKVSFHMNGIFSYLLILTAAVLCFGAVTSGGSPLMKTFVICLSVVLALILLLGYFKNLLLERGKSKGLLAALNVLLALILVGGVIFSMNSLNRADTLFSGSLPVRAQDVGLHEDSESLMEYGRSKASFLLRHTEASQVDMKEDGSYDAVLSYELVDSRMMGVDGFVTEHYLNRMSGAAMMTEDGELVHPNHYEQADPAPWGAEKAWQVVTEGEKGNVFLLLFEDRLAEIGSAVPFTPEQMKAIGEKLR